MLIDSHCHLYMPEFEADRPEILARARAAGLVAFVVIGYDLSSSRRAVDLAEREPDIYACVAIHPHHASNATAHALVELEGLASHPKVVGVGEVGLQLERAPPRVRNPLREGDGGKRRHALLLDNEPQRYGVRAPPRNALTPARTASAS